MLAPDLARRHSRQIRLAGIGADGQAKLCAAEVSLGSSGFARFVEERYVRGAGLKVAAPPGAVAPSSAAPSSTELEPSLTSDRGGWDSAPRSHLEALGLSHDAAREVAEGALRALLAMHAALGSKP